jgi:hypothetical protein
MKKYRPRCPINGVLLVIPADSLIKDTADEIEQKASKIARQFDVIQRILDVRFPVFVVITKSDLINGFRDFFENLEDPQLQHQILGWSNPEPLDEPYNPDFVDLHLKAIRGRLFRRRLALLREVVSEEGETEKVRNADTLYAFPQSLTKIATRMARYLELIFSVGSKWSCKPLFFRGIYFTSSMREGSALDEDLAESLGVPIDSLPEGRVWERDRAYFLRDLFVKKIFREQGLVTYATNAKKQHRRRKAAVLISATVSMILLLFFTIYAASKFRRSIGEMKGYFMALATIMEKDDPWEAQKELQVIKREGKGCYAYRGGNPIGDEMTKDVMTFNVSTRLAVAVARWNREGVPWIFAPAAKFAASLEPENLMQAQAVIYEVGVLRPFVEAARDVINTQENGQWTFQDPETRALRQLIRLKAGIPFDDKGQYSAQTFLDHFAEYVFRCGQDGREQDSAGRMQKFNEDKPELHKPISIIYDKTWPPALLGTDPNYRDAAIARGVELFNQYWSDPNRLGADGREYARINTIQELTGALEDFNDAEIRILALQDRFAAKSGEPHTAEQLEDFVGNWNRSFASLKQARDNIARYASSINRSVTLEDLWRGAANVKAKEVELNYQFLLDDLDEPDPNKLRGGHFLARVRDDLEKHRDEILKRLRNPEFEERLRRLDERFYARIRDKKRLYEIRFEMYRQANTQLETAHRISSLLDVARAVEELDSAIEQAGNAVENMLSLDPGAFRFRDEAAPLSVFAMNLAEQRRLYHIVRTGLNAAPKKAEALDMLVKEQASWDWSGIPAQTVDKRYDPLAGAAALDGWKHLGTILKNRRLSDEKLLNRVYLDANDVYTDYAERSVDYYWLARVPEDVIKLEVEADSQQLAGLVVRDVFNKLGDFGKSIDAALDHFSRHVPQGNEKLKQFKANLDRITDRYKADRLYNTCRSVLTRWRRLSDDVWEARRTLLGVQPADFREDYTPFSYNAHAEFVDMYWTELTYHLLGELTKQVQDEGNRALRELKTGYGTKFPLDRGGREDLKAGELVKVRSLLNKVRLQEKFGPETIGNGAQTQAKKLDGLLDRLRGIDLAGSEGWFTGIERVLKFLPQGSNQYNCRVAIVGYDEQLRLNRQDEKLMVVLALVRNLRLVQIPDRSTPERTAQNRDEPIPFMVKYPGPPLSMEFYPFDAVEPTARKHFAAPWAPLRMLQECYDTSERKEACIRLDVGEKGVLYLQLKFFRDPKGKEPIDFSTFEGWLPLKR